MIVRCEVAVLAVGNENQLKHDFYGRLSERQDTNMSNGVGIKAVQRALVGCEEYHYLEVRQAVERGLQLLAVWNIWSAGEKIVLKPNLLAPDPPEKCVTTHPAAFKAMASPTASWS